MIRTRLVPLLDAVKVAQKTKYEKSQHSPNITAQHVEMIGNPYHVRLHHAQLIVQLIGMDGVHVAQQQAKEPKLKRLI
jgi:ribulose 1,5-bisphosphate carboxylase large subunit-like protein